MLAGTPPPTTSSRHFHVVGIGASAGGLNALQQFFTTMPADSDMAFVVVQHFSPDFRSEMDSLLHQCTTMPVRFVEDNALLEPNSVYLLPSTSHLTLKDGRLHLVSVSRGSHPQLPIDTFFSSLAEEAGAWGVGIILSGTGRDGSQGIQAIRRKGGLVVAQSPESAQFQDMPMNAIATGAVDHVLSPDAMPALLMDHRSAPTREVAGNQDLVEITENDGELAGIFTLLQRTFQLDFTKYKLGTVGRRIRRRMGFRQITAVPEYAAVLATDANELDDLYHDLLIGVTEFFRDKKAFHHLETVVIPDLFANLGADQDLRVWSAGCATGEEAYSLAILLAEKAAEVRFTGKILVFATDVHKRSLEQAAQGIFSRDRLAKVDPERLQRYFVEIEKDLFRVKGVLRKLLTFAHHDLTRDTPFSRLDLICCRNLLIYLRPEAQKKVISLFHFALNRNGFLFLGNSEGVGPFTVEFELLSNQHKIFRKIGDMKISVDLASTRASQAQVITRPGISTVQHGYVSMDRQIINDYDKLLDKHIPPGVLINEKRQIIHYFGNVADYLKTPKGRAETDLLLMVDDNLHVALSTSLQKVQKTGESVITRNVRIQSGKEDFQVDVTVDPIPYEKTSTLHYHIYLQRIRPVEPAPLPEAHEPADASIFESSSFYRQHITDLEMELQATREDLLSTQENLQATIEELNATNEEVQAANEELQSTNEELNSANEELHSTNEELYSVNTEFERNNSELKQLNIDLGNLLTSIDSGIVFLDRQMCIRKFNPAISSFFKLLPQDIGRPIDHIAYHLANQSEILTNIRAVLEVGAPVEKEVATSEGRWLLSRIMPFRTVAGEVEGVVIIFTDVTTIKESEQKLNRVNEELARSNRDLLEQIAEREQVEQELKLLNERLEARVGERTVELEDQNRELQKTYEGLEIETAKRVQALEELRKNEQLLIHQSRMAAMGEMLGNIAHQWRQPLNVLGLKIQEIGVAHELGELDKEVLDAGIAKSMEILRHLSQTIDDFRNFTKPDKEKSLFRVDEVVTKTISLVEDSFKEQKISLQASSFGDPQVNGYPNEYCQVVLNLLMNARDAVQRRGRSNGQVSVRSWVERGRSVLTITDNGGGIDEAIIGKIFDPYFTTKEQGKGTGVGLFMSKVIVEKNMGGRLTARNVEYGAEFRVEI